MSRLDIYADNNPSTPLATHTDPDAIARELAAVGVRFEQWRADKPLPRGADEALILATYADDIERLKREEGYRSVDTISLTPDHPARAALRRKFLDEHTHSEDEVRFFVDGAGLFTLHIGDRVYDILCVKGDLIGVPDGTPHWFDMGDAPRFTAIRLFTHREGWVAHPTGDDIAARFPRMRIPASA